MFNTFLSFTVFVSILGKYLNVSTDLHNSMVPFLSQFLRDLLRIFVWGLALIRCKETLEAVRSVTRFSKSMVYMESTVEKV